MVRVLIVEDHDMARVGLSVILGKIRNLEIADMSADGQEGVDKALELTPDVDDYGYRASDYRRH